MLGYTPAEIPKRLERRESRVEILHRDTALVLTVVVKLQRRRPVAKSLFLPLPSLSPHAALPRRDLLLLASGQTKKFWLLLQTANFDGPGASSSLAPERLERERPWGVAGITVKN